MSWKARMTWCHVCLVAESRRNESRSLPILSLLSPQTSAHRGSRGSLQVIVLLPLILQIEAARILLGHGIPAEALVVDAHTHQLFERHQPPSQHIVFARALQRGGYRLSAQRL